MSGDIIHGWKKELNFFFFSPHKWPRKKISCLMRFQSAELLNKCGRTTETSGCSRLIILMLDTVSYMVALSNFHSKRQLDRVIISFGVNDAWFDSRGQAVGCFIACISHFQALGLAILGWKGCHGPIFTGKCDTKKRTYITYIRINIKDMQHIAAYFITVDLCAFKNTMAHLWMSLMIYWLLNKPVLFLGNGIVVTQCAFYLIHDMSNRFTQGLRLQ